MAEDEFEKKKKHVRKEPKEFASFNPEMYWTVVRKGEKPSVIPNKDRLEDARAKYMKRIREMPAELPELPVDQQRLLEDIYERFKDDPERADVAKAETESILRRTIFPEFLLTSIDDEKVIREMAKQRGLKFPRKR